MRHAPHRGPTTMTIEQGRCMPVPSPSVIDVRLEVDGDAITRLDVGGRADVQHRRVV